MCPEQGQLVSELSSEPRAGFNLDSVLGAWGHPNPSHTSSGEGDWLCEEEIFTCWYVKNLGWLALC